MSPFKNFPMKNTLGEILFPCFMIFPEKKRPQNIGDKGNIKKEGKITCPQIIVFVSVP